MKIIISLSFIIISFYGNAQSAFSLKEAIQYGLTNNLDIKNSSVDMEIAEKKIWETTSIGLPQISGSAQFKNFIDIPTTVVPAIMFNPNAGENEMMGLKFGTDYNLTGTLQVSQLIFSGNYLVGLQASKTYSNISKQVKEKKELDVKESITSAYYTVIVLKANKDVLDSTMKTIEKLYEQTKILVDEKVIESTNASQLELTVLQITNALSQINYQIEIAKNLLKFNMGYSISNEIELTETLDNYTQQVLDEISLSLNTQENIDYRLLTTQMQLKQLSLKNTKANYLPTLSGFFSHQQVGQRNQFNYFDGSQPWYPTTLWGLNLDIPIFSSGQKASQVNQAKLEVEKMENSLLQLDEGLKLQISQAVAEYKTAYESFQTQQKATDVAGSVLKNTIIKYKEGVVSSMELTQTQNQFLQTQTELVKANFNLLNTKLKIDKLQNNL